jgi:ABC-type phosphate transport system substrate-binding protein
MRKRRLFLVAGACVATLSLAVGTALADPVPAQPPFRALQGVGSDTTQDIMTAYANGTNVITPAFPGIKDASGNLIIASWDASPGSATITTKALSQCANIPRPNGSGDGINALAGLKAGFPKECTDFARSSTNDAAARTNQGLTYIPFALDALTYATFGQSNVPKNLTTAQLQTIFRKNKNPDGSGCTFKPRMPNNLSGTYKTWLQRYGLNGAFGTCVDQTRSTPGPNLIEEHDGSLIGTDPDAIIPFGVGPWESQTTNKSITDRHGGAILRGIDGQSPFNFATFPGSRLLFNVIRTSDINNEPWKSTFIGTSSQICQHPEILSTQGLQPLPGTDPTNTCGSTTIQTP